MINFITEHIDIWTAAQIQKNNSGRGRGKNSNDKTPHGIKKLRELILELAVRGKLEPQDPNDEPASELLEKIAKEKERLIKEGKIKKQKLLPEISEDEKPFDLPFGWEWVRFQDVSTYIQRGKGPKYADEGKVKVISQKCIQWSGFNLSKARFVDDDSLNAYQPERFLECNDLLWNSTGTGTVGRINILSEVEPNTLVADSHVTVIRPLQVSSDFLRCYVAAPGIQLRIEPENEYSLVSGTTKQVELNTRAVQPLLVPVPPLSEQHRIVAKVDELMALCDHLEQQQTDSNATHQTLVETLLATLTNAANQKEFAKAWQRIATHFATLFTTAQSIDQLKQTILQLAVMGKLVPQDPNDEPTSVLLEKIAKEKARLIKEGKIKKQKPLPEIEEEDQLFNLPTGWNWVRLGVVHDVTSSKRIHVKDYVSKGVPFFRSKEIGELGRGDQISTEIHIARDRYEELKKAPGFPHPGDIMLASIGASIGNNWICDDRAFYYKDGNVTKIGNHSFANMRYLQIFMESRALWSQVTNEIAGSAYNALTIIKIKELLFPLPPLPEQHRIVAKADELIAICGNLKTRLNDAQTAQVQLADILVEHAVA